jgi:hypothetical protein
VDSSCLRMVVGILFNALMQMQWASMYHNKRKRTCNLPTYLLFTIAILITVRLNDFSLPTNLTASRVCPLQAASCSMLLRCLHTKYRLGDSFSYLYSSAASLLWPALLVQVAQARAHPLPQELPVCGKVVLD